jgi:hypothetical protein
VKTLIDARLREEASRFAFRFACDHCAHFDEARERCSLAYPAAPRRHALDGDGLEFCKAFDLG